MARLVLIRHGQSIWNKENRFTGWIDVELSQNGIEEAESAGVQLKDFKFDLTFTSELQRAQETLKYILKENNFIDNFRIIHDSQVGGEWYNNIKSEDLNLFEVHISNRLNERYYGDLQGLNKEKTIEKYGEEQVHLWRRSYDIAPPNGESLEMTSKRTIPYFKEKIKSGFIDGKDIIIVAHGNSLRSIIMHIEKLSKDEILDVEIPTGTPIVYELDSQMNILDKKILN